jgi:hypothetical protein
MIQINLKPEEALILRETLETALSELRFEIADTDSRAYRNDLKHRRVVLQQVIETLAVSDGNLGTAEAVNS